MNKMKKQCVQPHILMMREKGRLNLQLGGQGSDVLHLLTLKRRVVPVLEMNCQDTGKVWMIRENTETVTILLPSHDSRIIDVRFFDHHLNDNGKWRLDVGRRSGGELSSTPSLRGHFVASHNNESLSIFKLYRAQDLGVSGLYFLFSFR